MGFEGDKMHIPVAFRFRLCLSIRLKHLQNTMRLKKKKKHYEGQRPYHWHDKRLYFPDVPLEGGT